MGTEQYFTAQETMDLLNISKARLYHYLKAGRFKTAQKRNGTRWFIGESDIKAFLRGELDLSGVYAKEK